MIQKDYDILLEPEICSQCDGSGVMEYFPLSELVLKVETCSACDGYGHSKNNFRIHRKTVESIVDFLRQSSKILNSLIIDKEHGTPCKEPSSHPRRKKDD